jgi:hypothetical protein
LPRPVTASAASLARFHLDENQHAAAARHDIDFAGRRFEPAGEDAVALGDQQHGGAAFG